MSEEQDAATAPPEPAAPAAARGDGEDAPGRRMRLRGLHHVTGIVRDLERTTAFYRDILGLALVESTVNDDDPDARHFWFGDGAGSAGTLVSFSEYPAMEQAAHGRGALHHFAFLISERDELIAWRDYLRSRGVACSEIYDRGQFSSVYLHDPDGHLIELATPPGS